MTNDDSMTSPEFRTIYFLRLDIPLSFDIRNSPLKKYRPPRPMDAKGGCSPQNNLENWDASNRGSRRRQQQFAGNCRTMFRTLQRKHVIIRNFRASWNQNFQNSAGSERSLSAKTLHLCNIAATQDFATATRPSCVAARARGFFIADADEIKANELSML